MAIQKVEARVPLTDAWIRSFLLYREPGSGVGDRVHVLETLRKTLVGQTVPESVVKASRFEEFLPWL